MLQNCRPLCTEDHPSQVCLVGNGHWAGGKLLASLELEEIIFLPDHTNSAMWLKVPMYVMKEHGFLCPPQVRSHIFD